MIQTTKRCPFFLPILPGILENCVNCLDRPGKECGDNALQKEKYEDTAKFRIWERMMQSNRGVKLE